MNRCIAILLVALATALPAQAQRLFERSALRGELTITVPPEALLNGKPVRLAPGARIRDELNKVVLSGAVLDKKLVVNYTIDGMGLVRDVWILSAAEAAREPWPRSAEQAQAWLFDPTFQRWSKP